MKILFFDDDIKRHKKFSRGVIGHKVTFVFNVSDAIKALNEEIFDVIYLDHDMLPGIHQEPGSETGWAVAQHIAKLPREQFPLSVIVHSYNRKAAELMTRHINKAGIRCVSRMFNTESAAFFKEIRRFD